MKSKEFYLKQLKYFKGEEENPFKDHDKGLLWFYERVWFLDRSTNKNNLHAEYISDLASAGLLDLPRTMPVSYQGVLFNSFRKQSMTTIETDAKEFRKFYLKYYKGAD